VPVQVGVGYIDIKPDLSGFSRELRTRVARDMGAAGDQAGQKLGSSLTASIKGAVAGFGAAFAGAKLTGFIGDAVGAASDLAESVNKSNQVFGSSGTVISTWAEGAAQNIGLSKQAALDAAGTFGNMFAQLGVGSAQAADLSKQMVNLAADFASFHNANIEDVILAQASAFRGEYDALQRFLPTITAATVEQRALALTGKKTVSTLTAQEKALAVNKLMMEGAGDATGDFARTSDGLANQQRILNAEWANTKTELGQNLLPIMSSLAGFMNDTLLPAFKTLFTSGGDATGWAATISNVVGDLMGFLAGVLQQTLRFFANAVSKLPFGWGDEMAEDFREAADAADPFRDKMHASKEEMLGWAGATRNADAAMKLLTTTTKGATAAVADQSKAIRESSKATREAAASERSLRQARKALADLIKEGAVNDKEVVEARKSLADATRDAARANRDLADAQEEYDEAAAAAAILGTDTALEKAEDAADNLADATESAASAQEAAKDAALALAKAQAGDPEFQDKLADARDKVADAEDKVAAAETKTVAQTPAVVASIGKKTEAVKLLNDQLGITADHVGILTDSGNILAGAVAGMGPLGPGVAGPLAPGQTRTPFPLAPGVAGPPAPGQDRAVGPAMTTVQVDMTVLGPAPDPALLGKAIAWAL
jgi:hypothetical protein